MSILSMILQVTPDLTEVVQPVVEKENYFQLLLKGGWILVPLFILSLLAIYIIINRVLVIGRLGKSDSIWLSRVSELVQERKIEKAIKSCNERSFCSARVVSAGLKEINRSDQEIQDAMQSEARQQIAVLENQMSYLGITASIAPMLGFVGTIFGVIKIFYNISVTNDLNIASISDGLYQKMICSGVGLLVGIVAYAGYYILNSKIDKVVLHLDKDSNEMLKSIRICKRGERVQS